MNFTNTLPAPYWRGTPPNLVGQWLEFCETHHVQQQQAIPTTLERELEDAEYDLHYNQSMLEEERQALRYAKEDLTVLQTANTDAFDPKIVDAVMALPGVIGARCNTLGSVVLLVRYEEDGRWLGDFEVQAVKVHHTRRYRDSITFVTTQVASGTHNLSPRALGSFTDPVSGNTGFQREIYSSFDLVEVSKNMIEEVRRTLHYSYGPPPDTAPEPNYVGMQGDVGMFQKLHKLLDNRTQRLQELEELIASTREREQRLVEDIRSRRTQIREIKSKLANFQPSDGLDEASALRQLRAITRTPGVVGVRFDRGIPVLMLRASIANNGQRLDLGDYEVAFRAQHGFDNQIHARQTREPLSGVNPYWETTYFCFGVRKEAIWKMFENSQFSDMTQIIVNSICSFNDDDANYYLPKLAPVADRKPVIRQRKRPRRRPKQ